MKNFIRAGLCILVVAAFEALLPSAHNPKTMFVPRSQSENFARDYAMAGAYTQEYTQNHDSSGEFSLATEYSSSFRPDLITNYFFGQAAHAGTITISGSNVSDRGEFDLLADYFGLPQDFVSTVHFKPSIKNFIADFDFYYDFGELAPHAYIRIIAPLVYTRWTMNPCEHIEEQGIQNSPAGYYTKGFNTGGTNNIGLYRSELPQTALEYFDGRATFGDMKSPLEFGKISQKAQSRTRFADIFVYLGWDFVDSSQAQTGFYLVGAFPAGNAPDAELLFEPIVGNGGHFCLGLGFAAHYKLWHCEQTTQAITLFFDIKGIHLFSGDEVRSFDFKNNGPGSRYILLANYQDSLRNRDGSLKNYQALNNDDSVEYAGSLEPAINQTTLCCDVSIQLVADCVLMLAYNHKNFEFDFGYNFWGRTAERVIINDTIEPGRYALKGDAFLYGAATTIGVSPTVPGDPTLTQQLDALTNYPQNASALAALESHTATLYAGGNFSQTAVDPLLNPGIDNPAPTTALVNGTIRNVYSPTAEATAARINTSQEMQYIRSRNATNSSTTELDALSATAPSAKTHKFFMHIGHAWDEGWSATKRWCYSGSLTPFIGCGLEIEFDTARKCTGNKTCNGRGELNQWGIWIKGGFSFGQPLPHNELPSSNTEGSFNA